MPTKPISHELMQRTVNDVARYGGVTKAAHATGQKRGTVQARYDTAKAQGVKPTVEPVESTDPRDKIISNLRDEVERLTALNQKAGRPHFTVRQDNIARSSKIRVVCIGDAHDSPNIPDKSRFEWIGRYIRQSKPDVVVQIGDFATLDSLNSHIPNESLDGKLKPSFEKDMGSFNLALQAMQLDGVEKHCTLGNHERRLYHYEQNHPEMEGKLSCSLDSILKNNGWTYSPYGFITTYGGVGFVHAALSVMGKTIGGKNAEVTIANESCMDLVIGHSHVERSHRARKLNHQHVTIQNVGCALPDGFIEDYALHALTGWSYGISELTIQHGHLQDRHWISMAQLKERFDAKRAA